jgi:hypothetical protein
VAVEGPRGAIAADAPSRYTVRITNGGSVPVNDLIVLRPVQRGFAGNNEGTTCSNLCAFPPLAPGATLTFAFEITPERTGTDPTARLQFEVRAQSLGRFDASPADNIVAVTAAAGTSQGGGGGGGDGGSSGGGGFAGASLLALLVAGAMIRPACVSRRVRTYLNGR